MNKQTSSRVSTIAANILQIEDWGDPAQVPATEYNNLLADAKILAGSVLSQDETPGQQNSDEPDFLVRLRGERADLDRRLSALTGYLSREPGKPNPRHNDMLVRKANLMSELLAVLDERIADIAISRRSGRSETEKTENTDGE